MLKHRLLSGTLMTLSFIGLVILDGWLDGSLTASTADDRQVRGTLVLILIIFLVIATHFELSRLAAAKNLKAFGPVSIIGSILLASTWYWPQLIDISTRHYMSFALAFVLMGLFLSQYIRYGTEGMLANCGANCFSILYLGLLSGFALAIRINFGVWPLLMFVFAVKCSDIGAYAIGSLFGKHKFSPKISPGKTWEGMAAAIASAIIVAFVFAVSFDIMVWWLAVIFGLCIAFAAQAGDLVESMIKRDARQKDSAKNVPGFGGILDVIDSPLVAAPFGYLFFMLFANRFP
jgi:phosphatidate cytidylyltransferase